MAYEKINWQNGGPPGISAERLAHMQTQYEEAAADLAVHNSASDPHPQYTTASELASAITTHEQAVDPHPAYAQDTDLSAHLADAAQYRYNNRIKKLMGVTY